MHRNPRLSAKMHPLRENTMRLGHAMKYGKILLDLGIPIQLWDGSGWEVHIRPDDSFSTSSGRAREGGRRYLARGAGLVKTWPITLLTDAIKPGAFIGVPAIKHFLAHRRATVGQNPGTCINPLCKASVRRNSGEPLPELDRKFYRLQDKLDAMKKEGTAGSAEYMAVLKEMQEVGRERLKASGLGSRTLKNPRRARANMNDAGENPRIAHEEIVGAFLAGRPKKVGPRYWTDGQLLRVWGNLVAKKVPGGVDIMDAGYRTLLTKNVLNTVLRHMGAGTIWQQARRWYISTPQGKVEWPGQWTVPYSGAAANRGRRVRRNGRGENLTVSDISQWIDNDEGLYNWWRSSRQSKAAFIRENRAELEAAIRRVLNRPPAGKTWRDYARNPRVRAWNIVAISPGRGREVMQSGHKDKAKAEDVARVYRRIAKKEGRLHTRYAVEPFRYSDWRTRLKKNPLTQKEVDQLRRNETFYRMGQRVEVRAGNTKDAMQLQGAMQESRVIRQQHRAKGVAFRPGPQGLTLRQIDALPNPGSNAWNVYLGGKLIDTVFYSASARVTADEVKRSLVGHDGYDPRITVRRSNRFGGKKANPLTRREAAAEIREIINAREQSLRVRPKPGGRDASNWQDGYAHGVAGAVYRRGPRSAMRAVERAVQHDVRNRVYGRGRAAANPHAGLGGLMTKGAARNASRFGRI